MEETGKMKAKGGRHLVNEEEEREQDNRMG